MAARRFIKPATNWAFITERIPEVQKTEFLAFKSKADGYFRKVAALPEEPPKIDWNFYKGKIPVQGLVDSFQKQYESFKVPYPTNAYTDAYDKSEKEALQKVDQYIAESNKQIKEEEANIKYWDTVPPFEHMTLQEFAEYFPESAYNPDKPTYWPHRPEDQLTEEDEIEWQKKLKGEVAH